MITPVYIHLALETQTEVKKTAPLATGGHCCSMGSDFNAVELKVF